MEGVVRPPSSFAMTVGSRDSERTLVGQRVPLGEGLTGLAAVTREVQIGSPLYDGVRQAERREGAEGGIESVIAAPMLAGDSLVGVITAVSFDPETQFGSEAATLYARAASVAGVLVDQRRQLDLLGASIAATPSQVLAARDAEGPRERINAAVQRLAESDPGRLEQLAQLLESLEAVVSPGER